VQRELQIDNVQVTGAMLKKKEEKGDLGNTKGGGREFSFLANVWKR